MNTFRRFLSIMALLSVVGASYASADDTAEARLRYNEGRAALEAGRYREAALHFEATGRLRNHGAAAFAAALAWDKAEDPVRAADNFYLALELPGLNKKDKREAQQRLDVLELSLGTVVVSGPKELAVQFERSTEAHPPARLHAPPGLNTLLVARGERIERREIKMKAGEVVVLDVTEPVRAPEPEPSPPGPETVSAPPPSNAVEADPEPNQTRRIIGYSAIGVGVISAGVATTLGFKAVAARDDYEANPTRETLDDAKALRMWTNVAWAGAAGFGAVGAVVLLGRVGENKAGQGRSSVSFSSTLTGVQLRGSF